jgi:hypothetical protein
MIQEAARYLLSRTDFLDKLIFEAVTLSRRMCEYERLENVSLDATFEVTFNLPEKPNEVPHFKVAHLVFDISRHNPITLKCSWLDDKLQIHQQEAALLSFDDCLHMEGPGFDDVEAISVLVEHRLQTLAKGEEISNYGILNTSPGKYPRIVAKLKKEIGLES